MKQLESKQNDDLNEMSKEELHTLVNDIKRQKMVRNNLEK